MMRAFPGFPDRPAQTMVPTLWLRAVLAEAESLAELKLTLHAFRLLHARRESPRYVRVSELRADSATMASLAAAGGLRPDAALADGVRLAVARGTFLAVPAAVARGVEPPAPDASAAEPAPLAAARPTPPAEPHATSNGGSCLAPASAAPADGDDDLLLFLNTPTNRRLLERIAAGAVRLTLDATPAPAAPPARRPTIFELYEQNIGLLTPLLVEELREAAESYPAEWIEEAFREAVGYNRRHWRYVRRVLENWATQGRGERGVAGGRPKPPRDAQRYLEGKFGHLIQH